MPPAPVRRARMLVGLLLVVAALTVAAVVLALLNWYYNRPVTLDDSLRGDRHTVTGTPWPALRT